MQGAEAADTMSFDMAEQNDRRKHPQCFISFDMVKQRVQGVVMTFDTV